MHKAFVRELASRVVGGQPLGMDLDIAAYYLARAIHDRFDEVENYRRPTPRQGTISVGDVPTARDAVKSALEA